MGDGVGDGDEEDVAVVDDVGEDVGVGESDGVIERVVVEEGEVVGVDEGEGRTHEMNVALPAAPLVVTAVLVVVIKPENVTGKASFTQELPPPPPPPP